MNYDSKLVFIGSNNVNTNDDPVFIDSKYCTRKCPFLTDVLNCHKLFCRKFDTFLDPKPESDGKRYSPDIHERSYHCVKMYKCEKED